MVTKQKTVEQMSLALRTIAQNRHYSKANNLFLAIERGDIPNSRSARNKVWHHVQKAYNTGDFMRDWWFGELEKLEQEAK